MKLIELKGIKKIYGQADSRVEALKNINLSIEPGELVAIMGASGSGKSTLLNILGLLDKQTEGEYLLKSESVKGLKNNQLAKKRNSTFGFVVQNFSLIQDYSVFENVKVPLDYTSMPRKEKKRRIEIMLEKMGISDKKGKLPRELSGGQNQRVAIARALVNDPEIILADEPTGALDKHTGQEMLKIFKQLNGEGKTIVIITHDPNIASQCNRTIYIEDGCLVKDVITGGES